MHHSVQRTWGGLIKDANQQIIKKLDMKLKGKCSQDWGDEGN